MEVLASASDMAKCSKMGPSAETTENEVVMVERVYAGNGVFQISTVKNIKKEELVAAESNPGTPGVPTSQSQIIADLLPLGKLPAPSPSGTSDTPVISLQGPRSFVDGPRLRVPIETELPDLSTVWEGQKPTLADVDKLVCHQAQARGDIALPTSGALDQATLVSQVVRARMRESDANRAIEAHRRGERSQWELDPDKVIVGDRIAVGGFAEVFVGKYEGTIVAIKLLLGVDSAALQRFQWEVDMLAGLRHPNLLLFMGYTARPALAMISEFMHRGSLFKVLSKQRGMLLDIKLQRTVAIGVARGMAYLHSRSPPIVHLDLKSPNILVDDRWRIKIADFGLSRIRHSSTVSMDAGGGTPEWMAPEVLRSEPYGEKADVYSYGVVLWEMLTAQLPWADLNTMQVVGAVGFQGKQLVVPNDGDPLLSRICSDCLSQNPDLRPSFPVILTLLEEALGSSGPSSFTTSLADANLNGLGHPQDFSRDEGVAGRVLDTELRSKHNAGLEGGRNLRTTSDEVNSIAITATSVDEPAQAPEQISHSLQPALEKQPHCNEELPLPRALIPLPEQLRTARQQPLPIYPVPRAESPLQGQQQQQQQQQQWLNQQRKVQQQQQNQARLISEALLPGHLQESQQMLRQLQTPASAEQGGCDKVYESPFKTAGLAKDSQQIPHQQSRSAEEEIVQQSATDEGLPQIDSAEQSHTEKSTKPHTRFATGCEVDRPEMGRTGSADFAAGYMRGSTDGYGQGRRVGMSEHAPSTSGVVTHNDNTSERPGTTEDAAMMERRLTEAMAAAAVADDHAGFERGMAEGLAEGLRQGGVTAFNRGRSEGISAGFATGRREGVSEGFASGSTAGFATGRSEGVSVGFATGREEGVSAGFASGSTAGFANGRSEGVSVGFATGREEGVSAGFASGSTAGFATGRSEGVSAGFATGRREGVAAGYARGSSAGFATGRSEGVFAGFATGRSEGVSAGFETGRKEGANAGFASGSTAGFATGLSDGTSVGLANASIEGFPADVYDGNTAGYASELQDAAHASHIGSTEPRVSREVSSPVNGHPPAVGFTHGVEEPPPGIRW